MIMDDIQKLVDLENRKNLVLIKYLRNFISDYVITGEYDTNNKNIKVIVVQENSGQKTLLYNGKSLFNYYSIDIFGLSIKESKEIANRIGLLVGRNDLIDVVNEESGITERWQLMFKQYSNPKTVDYMDVRRVAYNVILQCIINKVA